MKKFTLSFILKFGFAVFILTNICSHVLAQTVKSILFAQASETAEVQQGSTQSLLEYISASDNSPVSVKIKAVDNAGNIPSWLTVNGKMLSGISYTAGSEISFTFDATNLSIGTYYATVTASATGYNNGVLTVKLDVITTSTSTLANFKVNFQDSATVPPQGWLRDYGQPFGLRSSAYQGSGNDYGWIKRLDKTVLDLTKNGRKRTYPSDTLLSTFMHMQGTDLSVFYFTGTRIEGIWQARVPDGNYEVTVSAGDGANTNSRHTINVEGVAAISGFVPTSSVRFKSGTAIVSVSDEFLTVDAIGGFNTKINWISIKPSKVRRPSVIAVNPYSSSVNVSENTSISTSILKLPNGGINNATINSNTVFLTEEGTGVIVPANVNGTGGGDAITLVPVSPLKTSTTYRFTITAGVKDLSNSSFIPYSSTFTTGASSGGDLTTVKFDKVDLPSATGQHSSLTIGPDGKLYALTIDGIIKRFTIKSDGTLSQPVLLFSLQDHYGTRVQRLAIGFAFDPSATASNLVAWITHNTFVFLNGPDMDGKLSRLSGPNLETVEDILINLPRSKKDHLANSIAFGPDKALYFTQGSMSGMGRLDKTWGYRNERLLSAAVLRLDVSKLGTRPLDVRTPETGGTYNPYNPNAPLTIYASGTRNAYDLVWHSNGSLYVPTNGSAAGGNTPASVNGTLRPSGLTYNGPYVPALNNVQQTQKDFLFRVVKGGYYGHPNPLRGQYVMNGGNPTSPIDPAQVKEYPFGTKPDVNYRGYSYDFQTNASPDGAIEYKSNTFNGVLKGKLLVVRYSQHDDVITLTPGGLHNDIVSATEGYSIEGFSGFNDPLDLTEDVRNGNIYVSEYGGEGKIVLLKPRKLITVPVKKTLTAIADAFVRNGDSAAVNYGNYDSLFVKGSETVRFNRATYLKFKLDKSIKHAYRAVLRLYGKNVESFGLINVSAYVVTNDSWTERGITWNNAPTSQTTSLGSAGCTFDEKYYEIDVTGFVRAQLAGDSIVSLAIKDAATQDKKVTFRSKENATNKPQLVITVDTVTITSSKSAITFAPVRMSASRPSCDDPNELAVPADNTIALISPWEKPKIYPNPAYKRFNLQFPRNYEGNVILQIADAVGKSYQIGKYQLKAGGSNIDINLSNLSLKSGTYFLKINSETKTEVIKLIIQ